MGHGASIAAFGPTGRMPEQLSKRQVQLISGLHFDEQKWSNICDDTCKDTISRTKWLKYLATRNANNVHHSADCVTQKAATTHTTDSNSDSDLSNTQSSEESAEEQDLAKLGASNPTTTGKCSASTIKKEAEKEETEEFPWIDLGSQTVTAEKTEIIQKNIDSKVGQNNSSFEQIQIKPKESYDFIHEAPKYSEANSIADKAKVKVDESQLLLQELITAYAKGVTEAQNFENWKTNQERFKPALKRWEKFKSVLPLLITRKHVSSRSALIYNIEVDVDSPFYFREMLHSNYIAIVNTVPIYDPGSASYICNTARKRYPIQTGDELIRVNNIDIRSPRRLSLASLIPILETKNEAIERNLNVQDDNSKSVHGFASQIKYNCGFVTVASGLQLQFQRRCPDWQAEINKIFDLVGADADQLNFKQAQLSSFGRMFTQACCQDVTMLLFDEMRRDGKVSRYTESGLDPATDKPEVILETRHTDPTQYSNETFQADFPDFAIPKKVTTTDLYSYDAQPSSMNLPFPIYVGHGLLFTIFTDDEASQFNANIKANDGNICCNGSEHIFEKLASNDIRAHNFVGRLRWNGAANKFERSNFKNLFDSEFYSSILQQFICIESFDTCHIPLITLVRHLGYVIMVQAQVTGSCITQASDSEQNSNITLMPADSECSFDSIQVKLNLLQTLKKYIMPTIPNHQSSVTFASDIITTALPTQKRLVKRGFDKFYLHNLERCFEKRTPSFNWRLTFIPSHPMHHETIFSSEEVQKLESKLQCWGVSQVKVSKHFMNEREPVKILKSIHSLTNNGLPHRILRWLPHCSSMLMRTLPDGLTKQELASLIPLNVINVCGGTGWLICHASTQLNLSKTHNPTSSDQGKNCDNAARSTSFDVKSSFVCAAPSEVGDLDDNCERPDHLDVDWTPATSTVSKGDEELVSYGVVTSEKLASARETTAQDLREAGMQQNHRATALAAERDDDLIFFVTPSNVLPISSKINFQNVDKSICGNCILLFQNGWGYSGEYICHQVRPELKDVVPYVGNDLWEATCPADSHVSMFTAKNNVQNIHRKNRSEMDASLPITNTTSNINKTAPHMHDQQDCQWQDHVYRMRRGELLLKKKKISASVDETRDYVLDSCEGEGKCDAVQQRISKVCTRLFEYAQKKMHFGREKLHLVSLTNSGLSFLGIYHAHFVSDGSGPPTIQLHNGTPVYTLENEGNCFMYLNECFHEVAGSRKVIHTWRIGPVVGSTDSFWAEFTFHFDRPKVSSQSFYQDKSKKSASSNDYVAVDSWKYFPADYCSPYNGQWKCLGDDGQYRFDDSMSLNFVLEQVPGSVKFEDPGESLTVFGSKTCESVLKLDIYASLHSEGLNGKDLGLVRHQLKRHISQSQHSQVSANTEHSTVGTIAVSCATMKLLEQCTLSEMIARIFGTRMRRRTKNMLLNIKTGTNAVIFQRALSSDLLDQLFGKYSFAQLHKTGVQADDIDAFWQCQVKAWILAKYESAISKNEEEFKFDLRLSLQQLSWFFLWNRVCSLSGISLAEGSSQNGGCEKGVVSSKMKSIPLKVRSGLRSAVTKYLTLRLEPVVFKSTLELHHDFQHFTRWPPGLVLGLAALPILVRRFQILDPNLCTNTPFNHSHVDTFHTCVVEPICKVQIPSMKIWQILRFAQGMPIIFQHSSRNQDTLSSVVTLFHHAQCVIDTIRNFKRLPDTDKSVQNYILLEGLPSSLHILEDCVAYATIVEKTLVKDIINMNGPHALFVPTFITKWAPVLEKSYRCFAGFRYFGNLCSTEGTYRSLLRLQKHYENMEGYTLKAMQLQDVIWRYDATHSEIHSANSQNFLTTHFVAHVLQLWGAGKLDLAAQTVLKVIREHQISFFHQVPIYQVYKLRILMLGATLLHEAAYLTEEANICDMIHQCCTEPTYVAHCASEENKSTSSFIRNFKLLSDQCIFRKSMALQCLGEVTDPSLPLLYNAPLLFPLRAQAQKVCLLLVKMKNIYQCHQHYFSLYTTI